MDRRRRRAHFSSINFTERVNVGKAEKQGAIADRHTGSQPLCRQLATVTQMELDRSNPEDLPE